MDLAAVQELLQHAMPQQTLRYGKGAVKLLAAAAVESKARHQR